MRDRKTMQKKERLIPGNEFGRKRRLRFIAQYGMHQIGEQKPYFSITADVLSNGHMIAGGCMHDDITRWFKSLRELIRWHLCDQDGTPMHYLANGVYLWERCCQRLEKWERFSHSVLWGALPIDKKIKLSRLRLARNSKEAMRNILKRRLPMLQEEFHNCMSRYGVQYIH